MVTKLNGMKKEFKDFFANSSIHGLAYFFGGFNTLERVFWMLATGTMFTVAFVWINDALDEWAENKVTTRTESTTYPIEKVQFPTVTICPDFALDRWGFVRNILNLQDYEKHLESGSMFYNNIWDGIGGPALGSIEEIPRILGNIAFSSNIEMFTLIQEEIDYKYRWQAGHKIHQHIMAHKLADFVINFVAADNCSERIYYKLKMAMQDKILGRIDNEELYQRFGHNRSQVSTHEMLEYSRTEMAIIDLDNCSDKKFMDHYVLRIIASAAFPFPGKSSSLCNYIHT